MLVSIRLKSQLKEKIDSLVQTGLYPDFNSAAVVALENLITAEEEHAGVKLVPVVDTPVSSTEEIAGPAPAPARHSVGAWAGIPEHARQWLRDFAPDRFSRGDVVPLERWLFGQQNRLLPLKVNSRLLLAKCAALKSPATLRELADAVSADASGATMMLQRIDQQRGHKKEDLLATGFPAPDSDKSRQRYADQFVASENSSGELSGMLIDWKLATVERKKGRTYLFPTRACAALADLPNPLMDAATAPEPVIKFSEDELQWMLRHLGEHVHIESYAFTTLLRGIQAGANDPNKLDAHLRAAGALADTQQTSDEFVSTQRAGALSRMADLDLIRRVRQGVRISYVVTDRGAKWLKDFN